MMLEKKKDVAAIRTKLQTQHALCLKWAGSNFNPELKHTKVHSCNTNSVIFTTQWTLNSTDNAPFISKRGFENYLRYL